MTTKSLLFAGALGLATLSIASAKSYDITLNNPTKAGATELKPGRYSVKLEGSDAVFKDMNTYKTWKAPVKVENNNTKFNETVVETSTLGNMDHIQSIDLGGSRTKLEFPQ